MKQLPILKTPHPFPLILAAALAFACLWLPDTSQAARPGVPETIKSYCLDFNWGASRKASEAKVGLYGFTKPRKHGSGLVPLEPILSRPVHELKGDDRNIATLARAYHGVPLEATWTPEGGFTQWDNHETSETWYLFYNAVGNKGRGIGLITSKPLAGGSWWIDMAGFQPGHEYLREMKRYGVLPADYDLSHPAPVDSYALDEAYWRQFHHRPTPPAGR